MYLAMPHHKYMPLISNTLVEKEKKYLGLLYSFIVWYTKRLDFE